MRSMFYFAALAAAVSFTGCCGTGQSCKLGSHLGANRIATSAATSAASATMGQTSASMGDCGCAGEVIMQPASDCGCSAPVGDCGCSAPAGGSGCGSTGVTAENCTACGSDSVISVSAPFDCDGGCSTCGDVSEVQCAPAPTSAQAPAEARGLLANRDRAAKRDVSNNKGLGLFFKSRGKACSDDTPKVSRSLRRASDASVATSAGVETAECVECDSCETEACMPTVAQQPTEWSQDAGGRRISTGIISDIRGAHASRHADRGCGARGCGVGGGLCHGCLASKGLLRADHPYGGAVPHTRPQAGQSGMAPAYAYPYYTTRGPRDFLRDNPPSIGY